ncbi:hypothetical protein C2W62_53765, partial [Candidatus Entotheonella serta]
AITQGLLIVPQLALNGAILIACAVYLGWLSWSVFLPMAIVVLSGGTPAMTLQGKKTILAVSGGIAAFKALTVLRLLKRHGADP